MAYGAVKVVFEMPDDIAERTKTANLKQRPHRGAGSRRRCAEDGLAPRLGS